MQYSQSVGGKWGNERGQRGAILPGLFVLQTVQVRLLLRTSFGSGRFSHTLGACGVAIVRDGTDEADDQSACLNPQVRVRQGRQHRGCYEMVYFHVR